MGRVLGAIRRHAASAGHAAARTALGPRAAAFVAGRPVPPSRRRGSKSATGTGNAAADAAAAAGAATAPPAQPADATSRSPLARRAPPSRTHEALPVGMDAAAMAAAGADLPPAHRPSGKRGRGRGRRGGGGRTSADGMPSGSGGAHSHPELGFGPSPSPDEAYRAKSPTANKMGSISDAINGILGPPSSSRGGRGGRSRSAAAAADGNFGMGAGFGMGTGRPSVRISAFDSPSPSAHGGGHGRGHGRPPAPDDGPNALESLLGAGGPSDRPRRLSKARRKQIAPGNYPSRVW